MKPYFSTNNFIKRMLLCLKFTIGISFNKINIQRDIEMSHVSRTYNQTISKQIPRIALLCIQWMQLLYGKTSNLRAANRHFQHSRKLGLHDLYADVLLCEPFADWKTTKKNKPNTCLVLLMLFRFNYFLRKYYPE